MPLPALGVVVVTFNAADVILDCLESLLASDDVVLDIVVIDNASTDDTLATIRAWAAGSAGYVPAGGLPFPLSPCQKPVPLDGTSVGALPHCVHLVPTGINAGFAAGVNCGLKRLAAHRHLDRFWVLNPDSVVPADTPAAFMNHDPGPFSLMGGRVTYCERPDMIQIDGGTVNRWTGVTGNINLYGSIRERAAPKPEALDFITGASMVVSRAHYETVGPMAEDYFLYYEEVDWALRRGNLPLAICPAARVYHRGGSAIGSPVPGRPASPFSLYFKHRARLRFVRRHMPLSLPIAWAYTLAKAAQYALKGWHTEAYAVVAGARGVEPPRGVRERLGPEAARLAFVSG